MDVSILTNRIAPLPIIFFDELNFSFVSNFGSTFCKQTMKFVPKKDISTLEFHDSKGQENKIYPKVIRLFFKCERQYKKATNTSFNDV